jgi:hypothetical protein
MEWLFAEVEAAELELPRPEGFKAFRPVCGAGVPSAGREGEDLEKLGIGSESTMLRCYIVGLREMEIKYFGEAFKRLAAEEDGNSVA